VRDAREANHVDQCNHRNGGVMTNDNLKGSRSLDEIYALIDKSRSDAAKAARAKFHNDIEGAIATIAGIGAIASARVQADSRVASAKVLINAELVATRLLAEAELHASRCANEALSKPREVVESALLEIGKNTSLQLIAIAKDAVEKIQQDAATSIKVLQETGSIAIREVQTLAADVAEQTKRNAEQAAEKLKDYRRSARTAEETVSEGEDMARIILTAAQEASAVLQETIKRTLAEITNITDSACSAVHEAALAAEQKVLDGHERALKRLKETLQLYL